MAKAIAVLGLVVWGVVCGSLVPRGWAAPLDVPPFFQDVHTAFGVDDGLPPGAVRKIGRSDAGALLAETAAGVLTYADGCWVMLETPAERGAAEAVFNAQTEAERLAELPPGVTQIRDVARREDELVVAAAEGLYLFSEGVWKLVLPQMGYVRWAPVDVRAVVYDAAGQLWFAAPQGVGVREADGQWRLFTGAEGLPFNDFTCAAAGGDGVWFGTTNGAVCYRPDGWHFRQGGRWLVNNHVHDIHIDGEGNTWLATAGGISRIERRRITLAEKAAFYEAEIERRHRRTRYGFVNPAQLAVAGDVTTATPVFSDNDGFNTGLYLAAMSHAYAVTKQPHYQTLADNAFAALCFLGDVTQGGTHPAPPGFVARNVIPVGEPDPNLTYDLAYDQRRHAADTLWKIIQPRLPVDASGEWYWKCDSSSDELDGHFFGYATYFDLVCETEPQRERVREVVRRVVEHLLTHGYNLVDHDGTPTRWGRFSPLELNRDPAWCEERGLNSYSMLTYLSIAEHVTGESRYREIYEKLAVENGYGMNGMTQPKALPGPRGVGHQPDDNMAFLNYYHLIRYETDPRLRSMFLLAIQQHWQYEKWERNPFANFIYAACVEGQTRRDQWGEEDLSPPRACYEDAVETLRRYPLDLIEWPMSNAHRIDLVLKDDPPGAKGRGGRSDGYAFAVDERGETYWDWDPWELTAEADGSRLRPGFHYLLAYYLGRSHGFFAEPATEPDVERSAATAD